MIDIQLAHGSRNIEDLPGNKKFLDMLMKHKFLNERAWDGLDIWPSIDEVVSVLEKTLGKSDLSYGARHNKSGTFFIEFTSDDIELYIHLEVWEDSQVAIKMTGPTVDALKEKVYADMDEFLKDRILTDGGADGKVGVNFTFMGPHGANVVRRRIVVPKWDEISGNYPNRRELEKLINMKNPEDRGKLIFWHGDPGTGKSYAIRSLIHEWRDKAEFVVILDPEVYFSEPGYMMSSVVRDTEDDPTPSFRTRIDRANNEDKEDRGRLRVFVIEDGLKILEKDSRAELAEPMARLLNLTEGIVGQGFRILILVTTNEDLMSIDPAMLRHGRCLQKLEFVSFTKEHASMWLSGHMAKFDENTIGEMTLAEMYSLVHGTIDKEPVDGEPVDGNFGFTR